jgi:hypothetical protein
MCWDSYNRLGPFLRIEQARSLQLRYHARQAFAIRIAVLSTVLTSTTLRSEQSRSRMSNSLQGMEIHAGV